MVQYLFNDGLNHHDLSVVMELLADCVFHMPLVGDLQGEALSQFWATTLTAFPDAQRTIEEQFSDDIHVVSRWTATGTHQGHFMGVAPTGKRVTITGICIHRICGGKIVEEWQQWDSFGLMQQLGVMPTLKSEANQVI
jgi:steroid delta-isomerase-like uncharacterized protein